MAATGTEIASAYVSLHVNASQVATGVHEALGNAGGQAQQQGEEAGHTFGSALEKAAIIGIGVGVADKAKDVIGETITAASDLNEAGTAVQAVFGSAYDGIQKWAETANSTMGVSTVDALDAAKTFGVFGQAAGMASGENAKFSEGMVKLAGDLASFQNTTPQEALEAISAGLRGESEPLRRYGILLDDASERQKALSMHIYDGNGPLTQQQKILAVHALIVEKAGAATGDFQKTSGGLANQQRILGATVENLKAKLGSGLLPIVNKVIGAVTPFLSSLVQSPDGLRNVAIVVGVVLAGAFAAWTREIIISNAALLANPLTWVFVGALALIAGLIVGFFWLRDNWKQVCANVQKVFKATVGFLSGLWGGFIGGVKAAWSGITGFFGAIWNFILNVFAFALQKIDQMTGGGVTKLVGGIKGAIGWIMQAGASIGGFFAGLWNGIVSGVASFTGSVKSQVSPLAGWFSKTFGWIGGFVDGIWKGISTGVKTMADFVIGEIKKVLDFIGGLIGKVNAAGGKIRSGNKGSVIPGLASGGDVVSGGATLVGENGPEILQLPTGSRVTPLDHPSIAASNGGGGGNTINIYNPVSERGSDTLTKQRNVLAAQLAL